ncbi:MAG: glycerophosphoryl diester phosphodiesterase [Myxococcaceae bacterium]|nr:glycerophosphoryl diester phosphodiesterase [Myxococcaceae bacterium]
MTHGVQRNPLRLGHRGLPLRALENSLASFRAALDAGLDGFELDVQRTADGALVVLHDPTLERTAFGHGPLAQTARADLPRLRNGEAIPGLDEALALPARCVNVELKEGAAWRAALDAVVAAGALGRVIFSSFDHAAIDALRGHRPDADCGWLMHPGETLHDDPAALVARARGARLHLHGAAVLGRAAEWAPFAERIVLWGLPSMAEAALFGFTPAALIADEVG